jgi:hypothetical protein
VSRRPLPSAGGAPSWHRRLQLALATIWLLDGFLQLQPFMFTPGSSGFSGMLRTMSAGNPGFVARSIDWDASLVAHHAVLANAAFAAVQILIALGIAYRRTVKPALAVSIVWSLGVWWFGEGLGGVLHGSGTPLGGGPGAVLFYALLAVLLWPEAAEGDTPPFAAAGAVGVRGAKAVWLVVWSALAVLALLGSGRSPDGTQQLVKSLDTGQPGWLAHLDRLAASGSAGDGLGIAIAFACLAGLIAVGIFLPARLAQASLVTAIIVATAIWVVCENFGMILAGGATDPNSGPLLVLLALAYWPTPALATNRLVLPAAQPRGAVAVA